LFMKKLRTIPYWLMFMQFMYETTVKGFFRNQAKIDCRET